MKVRLAKKNMLQKFRLTFCLVGYDWRNACNQWQLEFISEYDDEHGENQTDAYKAIKQAYGYEPDEIEIIGILWVADLQETGYLENKQYIAHYHMIVHDELEPDRFERLPFSSSAEYGTLQLIEDARKAIFEATRARKNVSLDEVEDPSRREFWF